MPDVFISHSSKNDAIVTRIRAALKTAGMTSWVDHERGVTPGKTFTREILNALNACDVGLFVVSPDSVKSEWCEGEYLHILDLKKPLYLALVEDVPITDFPTRLKAIHHVDLRKDFDKGMAELAAAITGKTDSVDSAAIPAFTRSIIGRVDPDLAAIPLRGRDKELADVLEKLQRGVTLIVGVGGLDKSRLAAEAALTMPDIHGAIWQRASDVSRPDEVIELLREHFGLPITTDRRDVLAKLKNSRLLAVIDNAEDIKEDDPRRGDYVRLIQDIRAQGTPVLLTSRVEWDDLRYAGVVSPDRLDPAPAAQIVLDMKTALDVEHDLTAQADEIAQKALYHPRLIEWAVGQMRRFPPDKILRDLANLKSRSAQDALDEMIRKTLRDLTTAAGDLPEQVLRRLNVCRGSFTYDAALAIGKPDDTTDDDFDTAFEHLQIWRFVIYHDKQDRYHIDPVVIAAVPEDPAAHRPHYTYYKALARQHDKKQDYLGLDPDSDNLEAAFEWAMAAAEYKDAYWLYNACSDFLPNRGRFDQNKDWLERVAAQVVDHPEDYLKAAAQNSLGIVYKNHPTGDRAANLKRSIAAFEAALTYHKPDSAPLAYAMTQNNLGNAYSDLSEIEEREANLRRAIAAYEAALVYYTPGAAPLAYAMTQNNLGLAYQDIATIEDREANLRRAITAYEAALIYRTPQAAPLAYAGTQNNLGTAYSNLAGVEEREANLRRAIAAYEAALLYRTPQAAPLDYAATQNNLGTAYRDLSALEDREANLRRAVAAYEAALLYRTPGAAPLAYAQTQNNLGLAYWNLSDIEDREANLRRAITAYEAALIYRTSQAAPLDYAGTQNNLGMAYWSLSDIENEETNLRRAITAYEAALVYRTPQSAPLDYATTQAMLGDAYATLPDEQEEIANLRRAVIAYEAALGYVKPHAAPLLYSKIQSSLGVTWRDLGDKKQMAVCWREAERYYRQMGVIEQADFLAAWLRDLGVDGE